MYENLFLINYVFIFQIVTRQNPKNQLISGFSTILLSLARESQGNLVKNIKTDIEYQCEIAQWLDYCVLFINAASKDKSITSLLLSEINAYLRTKSYFVGQAVSLADLAIFYTIDELIRPLTPQQKEQYLNISRWYNHIQQLDIITEKDLINFAALRIL